MVSTVTVTTITTMATTGMGASLGIFCTIFLTGLLISKELLGFTDGARKQFIFRFLDQSIFPLLLSFITILALQVVEMVR